jgi:hypothetical protein
MSTSKYAPLRRGGNNPALQDAGLHSVLRPCGARDGVSAASECGGEPGAVPQHDEAGSWGAVPLLARDGTVRGHTLVDAELAGWVRRWTWRLSSTGYAVRSETCSGRKETIYLHRELLPPGEGKVVDHINGDRLDNRRRNLRVVSVGQNNANGQDRPRRSGFRGVYWHGPSRRWVGQISVAGRLRHLGLFDDPEKAARAYDLAARAAWGPLARTNGIA